MGSHHGHTRITRQAYLEGAANVPLQKRSFDQRTLHYADVREMMEEARPMILEKAQAMGKT